MHCDGVLQCRLRVQLSTVGRLSRSMERYISSSNELEVCRSGDTDRVHTSAVLLMLTSLFLARCLYCFLLFWLLNVSKGERNFHILYELVAGGATSGLAKQLKVKQNYRPKLTTLVQRDSSRMFCGSCFDLRRMLL